MKNPAIIIILLVASLAIGLGWWWLHPRDARRENMGEFESDMTEALLHGIIQDFDGNQPKPYYVTFGEAGTEPSRVFMARFSAHNPRVQGIVGASPGRGVVVQIIRIKRITEGAFVYSVKFPNLPAGDNRFLYRLSNASGNWAIERKLPDVLGR
jgi:hypothetical protein